MSHLTHKLIKSLTISAPSKLLSRSLATAPINHDSSVKGPTGVLLLNLGGPSNLDEVYPFLNRLFSDPELIPIPFQKYAAPIIARRRTPQIKEQYEKIGGGSPILSWTEKQGEEMVKLLDKLSPETAPHKPYIAFRYAPPLTEDTLKQIQADGVKRVIAFTQYPQYSCSTTGSSITELYRRIKEFNLENSIKWSVIDRWPTHSGLIEAFADRIQSKLLEYNEEDRKQVVILFSAHSLPMSVVNRGDTYPAEVGATVNRVMKKLNFSHPYRLVWQSQVGPSTWLGPQTNEAIKEMGKKGHKQLLLVPIAFTSDHIETLFELDLEYGEEAKENGIIGFKRAESLNASPIFTNALANIVNDHIKNGFPFSNQLAIRCPSCNNDQCKLSKDFFKKLSINSISNKANKNTISTHHSSEIHTL